MDYDLLDPGIRDLVRFLRNNRFRTTDSGDGVTKFDADGKELMECALRVPHVFMVTEPASLISEADRLRSLLETCGVCIEPQSELNTPYIQASYDPGEDRIAIIALMNVTFDLLYLP